MRLPGVRFTVRRLMVAVAIIAAILGLVEERRARFGRIALAHQKVVWNRLGVSDLEMYLLLTATQLGLDSSPSEREAFAKAEAERSRAIFPLLQYVNYHGLMADKYQRASQRPWLPVAPDPPTPPVPSKEWLRTLLDQMMRDDS